MINSAEDVIAIGKLKRLCIAKQLVRCDECCFVEPNGRYGVPYCMILTIINRRCGIQKDTYGLKEETIPEQCRFWTSTKREKEKRESIQKLKHVQSLIDKLTLAERKRIRLHTF